MLGDASEFVTVSGAARILGVNRGAIDRLIDEGKLWARRVPGCHARILRSKVEELAVESTVGPIELFNRPTSAVACA